MAKYKLAKIMKPKTLRVYKNNKLNSANFGNFTLNDYQVYLHLVSKICGINSNLEYLQPDQLVREYTLTAKEFSVVFGVCIDNCYVILKQAVDKLMKTDIKIERLELKELWRINICSMAKYNRQEGYITIKFTDDIMHYLAQVRAKFMHYNIKEIADFRSLYTTRLYELAVGFKNKKCFEISVNELREIFAVGDNYKRYADFKKYTFDHGCKEINRIYHNTMNLRFKEVKEGRKVARIQFMFDSIPVKIPALL